jgi:hypothetical protein
MRQRSICAALLVVLAITTACNFHQEPATAKTDAGTTAGQKPAPPGPEDTPKPIPALPAQPTPEPARPPAPPKGTTLAPHSRKVANPKVAASSRNAPRPIDPRVAELIDELTSPQRTIEKRVAWAEEEFQKRGIDVRHDQ